MGDLEIGSSVASGESGFEVVFLDVVLDFSKEIDKGLEVRSNVRDKIKKNKIK